MYLQILKMKKASMEDDIKILKVEYNSNQLMEHTQIGKLENTDLIYFMGGYL